jgi:hypothetical protein
MAAAVAAALLATAFVVSFVLGLRGPTRPPAALTSDPVVQQPPARAAGRIEVLNGGRAE